MKKVLIAVLGLAVAAATLTWDSRPWIYDEIASFNVIEQARRYSEALERCKAAFMRTGYINLNLPDGCEE